MKDIIIKMDEELNGEAEEWFLSWNAANGLVICVVYIKFIWWYLESCTACSAISNQSLLCSWNFNFHFYSSLHTLITSLYLYIQYNVLLPLPSPPKKSHLNTSCSWYSSGIYCTQVFLRSLQESVFASNTGYF